MNEEIWKTPQKKKQKKLIENKQFTILMTNKAKWKRPTIIGDDEMNGNAWFCLFGQQQIKIQFPSIAILVYFLC